MNILHVIETLDFGGAEQVTVHLANRLSEHHRITLCLVKGRGELIGRLADDIDRVCLDLGEGIHFGLPARLAALIRERAIDLVHVHNWALFFETWLGVRRAGRCRMLLTVHGPYTAYGPGAAQRAKRWLRHFVERMASRDARVGRIVTVSDAIQQYIRSDIGIPARKLQTIHNGIAGIGYHPLQYQGTVRLITVGRLAAVKNHALMLDALADCARRDRRLPLTVVGDGPLRAELEERVRELGLDGQVEFLGFRNDIAELLAAHDLFLLSSDYEGISIALLEAMRLGLPAVATRVGGIPETIVDGETGVLAPPRDARAYADALLRLAGSAELRWRMGAAAQRHFGAEFHEDRVLGKYLALYRELAGD